MRDARIVILGAGPTGLGAAYRLQELGYRDWAIYEADDHVGGLASSYVDEVGFTWDLGGHVMFSHYEYFDRLVERMLGDEHSMKLREAWVWMCDRFLPYPFQNNIRHLPKEIVWECVQGLLEIQDQSRFGRPTNFRELNLQKMGRGIVEHFMDPYNFKVWAHPTEMMDYQWIGERVSMVDLEKVLRNVILEQDNISWGPNNTFKFPLKGGTGGLYSPFVPYIREWLHLNQRATAIDPARKRVTFADGSTTEYDILISTLALDRAIDLMPAVPLEVREAARRLDYSGSHFVGIGVKGENPSTKCWMYFPEESSPFYRVTYLSNYSPYIAPPGHYSLLSETSYSPHKRVDPAAIVADVEQGMRNTTLLRDGDEIASRWHFHIDHSYPVPTLRRDAALRVLQPWLAGHDIVSRGRFGAWMYEIGNMDHSVMQGVEAINWLIEGEPETTWPGAQPKPLPSPVPPIAARRDAVVAVIGSGRRAPAATRPAIAAAAGPPSANTAAELLPLAETRTNAEEN
jgi:protoporphyrinogen oxidase